MTGTEMRGAALAALCVMLAACEPQERTSAGPVAEIAPAAEEPAAPAVAPGEPAPRAHAAVDAARLANADEEPGQWMSHGRTYSEQRFSPLNQITAANVSRLGLAWYADFDTNRGQEATPIVVDGSIYVSTAWSKVYAFDARTGAQLWKYDPEVPGAAGVKACCDVVNRGVAAWNGKIYVGTIDGRLVALDAATGLEVWDVNTVDTELPYTITGAPRVIKGKVIIGNAGADRGPVRGYVTAYDAETGAEAWRFYTVPGNPADGFESEAMEMAAATWTGEWWKGGGGGTVWDSMAYDPELDLLYIGVGNGSPWNHSQRSPEGGDNLFLASIVALDPDDGSYRWHYQTTPGETWDHTATQQITIADLAIDDATRRVVMQAPKNGFFYVLDAATGELLSAEPLTELSWATHVDMATGRPVETPEARYNETGETFISLQNPNGVHTWHSMAWSPETGLMYIPIHMYDFAFNPGSDIPPELRAEQADREYETARGELIAWDPVARRRVWTVTHEGPANGGALATAGGLVFQGTGGGALAARDARTGEELWSTDVQTGVLAAPVSYEVDGVQYVAIAVGSGGSWGMIGTRANMKGVVRANRSRLLVYALDGTAALPPVPPDAAVALNPPPAAAPQEVVDRGATLYAASCQRCHGANAANLGILPDLRYSAAIADAGVWSAIVLEGLKQSTGMVSFAETLDADGAEAIRAYVIAQANAAKSPAR
jgi:PQQ-dependent dehydrogenase (methanol/ethanol family)